jgi:cellobiose transport system substrate-binding protein
MTRKLTLRSALSLLAVAGLTLGGIQPAHAVTKTQVTIWSYGNVIEPWGEQEYERLHPNIDLKIKKNSMDAHHQSLITAFKANTTPDIAAIEVSYSGFFRAYPKYFTNLSGIVNENDYLDWRWNQGVGSDGKVIGIPTDVGGLQVAYRKDLFKAHGLPTDRAAVSALWPTWQKFIDTGKTYVSKLTATEKTSCKVKKVCFGFIDNAGTMYPAILNQGAKKYYETNGTLIYNTNANVKTAFTTTATAMNSGISTRINQFTSDLSLIHI